MAAELLALPRAKQHSFVVREKGDIAGLGYLIHFPGNPRKRHVANLGIVIADRSQGRGFGGALMRHMIRWARAHRLKKIWLSTYDDNRRAYRLYRGLGFTVEGIFMFDELAGPRWRHIYSMALFLDPAQRRAEERTRRRLLAGESERRRR